MKKVLFLWPPQNFFHGSLFKHYTYFAETMDYIRKKIDVRITAIDGGVELYSTDYYIHQIQESDFMVIYIEPYTIEMGIKMCTMAKQANPNIRTIAYGTACCYIPNFFINTGYIDAVVDHGYWETAILDFIKDDLDYAERGQALYAGLGRVGKIKEIPEDEWGHPAIDLIPLEQYYKLKKLRQLEIAVNKGCPYPCSFCTEKRVYGNKDLRRSIANIVQFLDQTHDKCDVYYFDSTTFTLNREWVVELCNRLKQLPYKVKWRTVTRLDALDDELILLMKEAGCYKISIGIETLWNNTQKDINKVIDISLMEEIFQKLQKHSIIPRALIMIGLKGQTHQEIVGTYTRLTELGVEVRIKEYYPYNELLKEDITLEEIRSLDRTQYYARRIENLSDADYYSILFSGEDK